ncbi:MAG: FeoB-associated Cys-rich membrane protein [Oscillospiraceae bacterium]
MFTFVLENLATIIISVVILGIVTLIIMKMRRDKKKDKSCGSGCSNCPSSSMCHK